MLNILKKQNLLNYLWIAVFALLATSSAIYFGIPAGNDLAQHYQFAQTIHQSIISGEFYPSFAPNLNYGFGDYAIRFYPPLAYYGLSGFFLLFGDWFYASLVFFFFIFWISGIGAYLWANEEYSPQQSLLAAALFIFAPYHINQIYNNFLFAEFASSAVIPFCFLFITRVVQKGRLIDILGLSISFACLLLTHLPLTILGSLVFSIYGLSLLKKGNFFKPLSKLILSVLVGFCAGSFYWIRLMTEKEWLNHSGEKYFSSIYNYKENFLFNPYNIINFFTDVTCLWLAELMLLAVLLISIPSFILFIKERKSLSRFNLAVGIVFFVSLFMVSPLSSFIWESVGVLQKVQFPWRFLGIISLSGALFASKGIIYASEALKQSKNLLLPLGLGIIFTFYFFSFLFIVKQSLYLPKSEFDKQISNLQNERSFDCWWMTWMKPEALSVKEKVVSGERKIEINSWNPLERKLVVSEDKGDLIQFAIFYYPHWKAIVNGQPTVVKANKMGLTTIIIPDKKSEIILYFEEPLINQFALIFSAIVWILISAFIFIMSLVDFKTNFKNQ